ncbi:MAG: ComF family protein [Bacteroidia bacterium]|jgi:ComF family protein|nr:ComF family protein [Bacteroidia bacterium]
MSGVRVILNDLLSLFYPEVCPCCGELLNHTEKTVCLSCHYLLPRTGFEQHADNPVARLFYGKVRLHAAMACYFFAKHGRVQPLIHELKYKSNREAGLFLGREMGKALRASEIYRDVSVLVPVPLHPKRERKRGYNQSEIIAQGIHEVTGLAISRNNLVRGVATQTQTKKTREERWKNVKDIFFVQHPEAFAGRHLLLIDDVITTGSTIEGCVKALEPIDGVRVSVAAAAMASG